MDDDAARQMVKGINLTPFDMNQFKHWFTTAQAFDAFCALLKHAPKGKAVALANEEEIGKYIDEIKNKFTNEEEFEKALASQNMNINSLKKKYAEQIKMKKIFERKVRSRVVILPTQVEGYYKEHLDEF